MIDTAKSWFKENQTLVYFLVAQFIAIGAAVLSVTTYMVRLETRVNTLEVRGSSLISERLSKVDNRLTVTEKETEANRARMERIVDIMTKELHIGPVRP